MSTRRPLLPGMSKAELVDDMALKTFGVTKTQGVKLRICICCKGDMTAPGLRLTPHHRDQYFKSGLCPSCYTRCITNKF